MTVALETQAQAAYALEQAYTAARDSSVSAEAHRQVSELQVKYDIQKNLLPKAEKNKILPYLSPLLNVAY